MDEWVNTRSLSAELDAAHDRARDAYARRDAAAYMSTFHRDLEYTQADGHTIGRDHIARQVRSQLARVHRASTAYHRQKLEAINASRAREVLEQDATFELRVFGILHREWKVHRRGRYEWERSEDGWQIRRVDVLSEKITSRTWFGLD